MHYKRTLTIPLGAIESFFLFGPRGTGKTTWLKEQFPNAIHLDLLESDLYRTLSAQPEKLVQLIPPNYNGWVIIDEVQKIPQLLAEVHRLIESQKYRFILTGSSARSLRKKGVDLLAGRALTRSFHPLIHQEIGSGFSLERSLLYGQLPQAYTTEVPEQFLASYVQTYLREEVLQEGLTRNIGNFSRFLEMAAFSQGEVLNISEVAREVGIERKVVESYFTILEDLLIGVRIPVFSKRAKRRLAAHQKFYYFDTGVFRALRPRGPLDSAKEIEGAALETLFLQEMRALNEYYNLGYIISYWRTHAGHEVDFVLYGKSGFLAIEIKRTSSISLADLGALELFTKDYPEAKAFLFCNAPRAEYRGNITILPIAEALATLPKILASL